MNCAHCNAPVGMAGKPPSSMVWCSPACNEAWFDARPEEAAKWIDVRDLNQVQRAELLGILGKVGKA